MTQHQLSRPGRPSDAAPRELVLDVGPVAHGGHFVARHEGRVVFVRHGIPGEKVRVRLTDAEDGSSFWRADVVEVLEASDDRRRHFWQPADSPAAWRKGVRPWAVPSSGTSAWNGSGG